jgi:hypothetical protein
MEDVNGPNDLRQLSHGQVKALEYSRYDINIYRFRTVKLEASRPLTATINNGVVTSGEDATGHVTDYCHTPFRDSGNEASIRVPRMFHSHV